MVALIARFRVAFEEILRIQLAVAKILVEFPVQLIGARARDDIYLSAGRTAEFGAIRVCLDTKFLNCFDRWLRDEAVVVRVIVVDAIK